MQSKATTVDLYLQEVPAERLPALTAIRNLCLKELKGYKEIMRYGMPCYEKNNVTEVSFASQKNNIALYILKQDVMEQYKPELKGVSIGKGCIRFTKPGKIDFEVVQKMLAGTYLSKHIICG
ncbi:iron chaperone [Ferruginibacter sp. SUN106]|uniref:iron chaperone n=1 Tax=Ferruginibacter sp. SUN106 TaxID=2978348 RepID=UPI003D36203A